MDDRTLRDFLLPALEALAEDVCRPPPGHPAYGACSPSGAGWRALSALAKVRSILFVPRPGRSRDTLERSVLVADLCIDLNAWFSFIFVNMSTSEGQQRFQGCTALGWQSTEARWVGFDSVVLLFAPNDYFRGELNARANRDFPDKDFAESILLHDPRPDLASPARTHLLAFYVYGALLAMSDVRVTRRPLFMCSSWGIRCVFAASHAENQSARPRADLVRLVVSVYGRLTNDQLQAEAAMETVVERVGFRGILWESALREHFQQKFVRGEVCPPKTLFTSSLAPPTFKSLQDMADGLPRLLAPEI